jgi:hypothetical protein
MRSQLGFKMADEPTQFRSTVKRCADSSALKFSRIRADLAIMRCVGHIQNISADTLSRNDFALTRSRNEFRNTLHTLFYFFVRARPPVWRRPESRGSARPRIPARGRGRTISRRGRRVFLPRGRCGKRHRCAVMKGARRRVLAPQGQTACRVGCLPDRLPSNFIARGVPSGRPSRPTGRESGGCQFIGDSVSDQREELWQRWIDKSADIRRRLGDSDCAAPFMSVAPPAYDPDHIPSILYIGKATRGLWGDREDSGEPLYRQEQFTPEKLTEYATGWLEKNIWSRGWRRPGSFWYFARSLSETVASATHTQIFDLQNLVWTNVCKIGVRSGNPLRKYLDLQKDLSIETLRFEISYYKPKIVVWVTGTYAEDVIDEVVNDRGRDTWQKENEDLLYWWRKPTVGMPAMIWAYHPQGKKQIILRAWLDKVRELSACPTFTRR